MLTDYRRIEKAIEYLQGHYLDQPNLNELAGHVNLSPFHFQRLFRRWAGISPKRYLQFLTVEHARGLLDESRTVLDATYDSGLSSPGRLHDLFVAIDAVTPGEFKAKGSGLQISYGIHPSPFGDCLIGVTERGICGLSFVDSLGREEAVAILRHCWREAKLNEDAEKTKPLVDHIFSTDTKNGKRSFTLLLRGTNFQIKVWDALLRIPRGFVCSYEDIARYVGVPAAARAVGNAVAANPVAYIIPCHRVIRKTGVVSDYQWGRTRKRVIIGWESARNYREGSGQEVSHVPSAL
ncbi:MAG: methylated-DNA--[protein]-cysteine S-methyltransferase [Proteobacteria bacterium]|nr:methylated-DNA--[protein]-cysteine S-methyltransferase [Pseudomonadota bacterium]